MRGGATKLFSGLPATNSSLGAMMGRRNGRLPEAWPRRFCITRLVTVIKADWGQWMVQSGQDRNGPDLVVGGGGNLVR